ncbi:hypothetical protein ACI2K4_14990 [Micromonospora sp. NPDC050397]|uniref:hypothetical protein n=1 Tax=Micromonospora sp. NPDC050397 TaxID=3364279 RepID=UPI00384C3687
MDAIDIDVDSLHRGADHLEQAKESVRSGFEGFQAAVQGYSNAFGGDDIGTLLGVAHQACVEAAIECFSTNLVELENYVDSLHGMAEEYQVIEERTTSIFKNILGSLGG